LDITEVSELENSTIVIIQSEPQKEKIMKNEQSLKDLRDNIKCSTVYEN
jgi:nitrate reductase NapAB chaperone NapD